MSKDKLIEKITFSAIMLSFGIVSTLVFKLVPMGPFSFLRFSLTPSIVIFVSIVAGPLFGAVVGIFSDLIPAFLLAVGGSYNPFLSIAYCALGVLPYFLARLVKKYSSFFKKPFVLYGLYGLFIVLLTITFYANPPLEEAFGENAYWIKPLILSLTFLTIVIFFVFLFFLNKKRENDPLYRNKSEFSLYEIAFISSISEALTMTIGKSLAFFAFGLIYNWNLSYWYFFSMLILGLAPSTLVDIFFISFLLPFKNRFQINR